mmetsp:Transcript_112394/g.350243  ORF Transcript_112394/g.350243 Transcript_112394/m.350243 type:complete len:203 (-) Transcript_112394:1130-1738(-)
MHTVPLDVGQESAALGLRRAEAEDAPDEALLHVHVDERLGLADFTRHLAAARHEYRRESSVSVAHWTLKFQGATANTRCVDALSLAHCTSRDALALGLVPQVGGIGRAAILQWYTALQLNDRCAIATDGAVPSCCADVARGARPLPERLDVSGRRGTGIRTVAHRRGAPGELRRRVHVVRRAASIEGKANEWRPADSQARLA